MVSEPTSFKNSLKIWARKRVHMLIFSGGNQLLDNVILIVSSLKFEVFMLAGLKLGPRIRWTSLTLIEIPLISVTFSFNLLC